VLTVLLRWAAEGRNTEVAEEAEEFTTTRATVDLPGSPARLPAWLEPVRATLGLVGVLAGAQLLVVNASSIAQRLGVSQVVIGFTLVALGTSVPELVTTIAAQRRRESDLVVGNLFGSNLFNSLAGGAVVGLATGRNTAPATSLALLVAMVGAAVIAWALLRRGLRLTRIEGAVLLTLYVASLPIVFAG
jgi:cation:H+ antiporter